jgi:3-hydroxy-9,10-secoandrosta-1,3,5(10)-triene-9,17-dione monooxygenase
MATANGQRPATSPPEPEPTAEELIRHAGDLRAYLRNEQKNTEERTYYSPELHEVFTQGGFYRMLQPKLFGGYEMSVPVFYRVIMEIARGCPSTGWSLALGSAHVVALASLFDVEVQRAAMGANGHFVAPSQVVPSATATRSRGGWLLDGTWNYCSGAPYSTHVLNAVALPQGADGSPRVGIALVPRECYTILDDWGDTLGLRGSGSHSIRVDKAEVPEGWVVPVDMTDVKQAETVGYDIHRNSMYAGRFTGFFYGELVALAIGIARAALDEYGVAMEQKKTVWAPPVRRAIDPQYLQWHGLALAKLDAAEAVVMRVGELFHELCDGAVAGERGFELGDDLRLASLALEGSNLATEVMDLVIRTGGSSCMRNGSAVQRYWRDFSTYRSHIVPLLQENIATRRAAESLGGTAGLSQVGLTPAGKPGSANGGAR